MGLNPLRRERVRIGVELAPQRAPARTRQSPADRGGGRISRSACVALSVAAGVDDEPFGHPQIPV